MSKEKCDGNKCEEYFHKIDKKLDKIDIQLRGNGREGLVTRVSNLEHSTTSIKKVLWAIYGLVATCVGTIFWSVFK